MSYITKNDLLLANGRPAIATSAEYVKMFYSQEDIEYSRKCSWYEGGTAELVVNVLFPDTGHTATLSISKIKKVS
jgi:hypothetical protein